MLFVVYNGNDKKDAGVDALSSMVFKVAGAEEHHWFYRKQPFNNIHNKAPANFINSTPPPKPTQDQELCARILEKIKEVWKSGKKMDQKEPRKIPSSVSSSPAVVVVPSSGPAATPSIITKDDMVRKKGVIPVFVRKDVPANVSTAVMDIVNNGSMNINEKANQLIKNHGDIFEQRKPRRGGGGSTTLVVAAGLAIGFGAAALLVALLRVRAQDRARAKESFESAQRAEAAPVPAPGEIAVRASPQEAADALMTRTPGFFTRWGLMNSRFRGVYPGSPDAAREYCYGPYRRALLDWETADPGGAVWSRVRSAAAVASAALSSSGSDQTFCRTAAAVSARPLRIALSDGTPAAEGGMAHTVGDIIVLPFPRAAREAPADLARLIAHEATHVAQRRDPVGASAWAERLGFTKMPPGWGADGKELGGELRANPDTDGFVWSHPARGGCAAVLSKETRYLKEAPVVCTKGTPAPGFRNPEHPFEIQAELCEKVVRG